MSGVLTETHEDVGRLALIHPPHWKQLDGERETLGLYLSSHPGIAVIWKNFHYNINAVERFNQIAVTISTVAGLVEASRIAMTKKAIV